VGTTPNRNIRIPDELWNAAAARADREDMTLSQLIRRVLRAYADGAHTFKM
jgi:predicted HicB family RNase H-like nuclease